MLSAAVYIGIKSILDDTDDDDLYSVLDTVTKGTCSSTDTRADAVRAILINTRNPSDLLKRQRITKRAIFDYLKRKGVLVPSDMKKPELIDECQKLWNTEAPLTGIEAIEFAESNKYAVPVKPEKRTKSKAGRSEKKKKRRRKEKYDRRNEYSDSSSYSSDSSD